MMLEQIPVLSQLPEDVRLVLVRILLVVLVVAIIWVSRRLLTWLIIRPLRWLVKRSQREIDDVLLEAVMTPTRYLVIAFALIVSAQILGADENITTFVSLVSRTLVIVALFLLLYRLVDILTPSSRQLFAFTGLTVQDRLLPFARTAIKVVVGTLAVLIIIQEWGYDVSGLITGLGLFGLAFSLAAKDTAENMFGFTAIVGDSPFNVGEYIVTPDVTGIVERVGIRSTRIRNLDQSLITVPNSKLAQSAVLNWSRLTKRWYNTTIGIAYTATSDDLRELLKRIREMLASREQVDASSVVVYFTDFGDSSLNILVRAYVGLSDWGAFTAEQEQINLAIMDIVADLGLSIAFPTRSVYVEQLPRGFDGQFKTPPMPEQSTPDQASKQVSPEQSGEPGAQEPPQWV